MSPKSSSTGGGDAEPTSGTQARRRVRRRTYLVARRLWRLLPKGLRDRLWPILFSASQPVEYVPARTRRPVRPTDEAANTARPIGPAAVTSSVTVILPVRDAGPELARTLESVSRQEGLSGLDLVVIDSGSRDGTRELAAATADRVLDVDPDDFGHGRTRNLAAGTTSADVLVMLVQDAVLLGRYALRDLVSGLEADPHHAAVSARQVPRSDADLYGAFVVVSHQGALDAARARPRRGRWSPAALRALAGLDNVCGAIRREAWEALRFADVDFGEDLDFGLRALERGWTIGRTSSAAVAHSHTRPPVDHLRRAVADRIYVTARVGEPPLPLPSSTTPGAALAAGVALVESLAGAMERVDCDGRCALWPALDRVGRLLETGVPRARPSGELADLRASLQGFATDSSPEIDELVRDQMGSLLRWRHLEEFARNRRTADAGELAGFIARLTASVVGRILGETLRLYGTADGFALERL